MRGCVIFCWLLIVGVVLWANVASLFERGGEEFAEPKDLSKRRSISNLRKKQSRPIRGGRNIPEERYSRLLSSKLSRREADPLSGAKESLELSWRAWLVPPPSASPTTAAPASPSMTLSESPSSSPTSQEDNAGYFQPLDRPIRIACAGDSLTKGTFGGHHMNNSYPFRLQEMLGEKYEVYNFGHNSATAIRGLSASYVRTAQFKASLNVDPDIYLLMLGHNDAKFWAERGQHYRGDMEWIVDKVRSISMESPARIIVAIPPWVKTDAYGIRNDVLVNSIHHEIQTIAILEDLQLVNMYDVTYNHTNSYIGDGLHLNAMGYRSLAAAWKVAIQCATKMAFVRLGKIVQHVLGIVT